MRGPEPHELMDSQIEQAELCGQITVTLGTTKDGWIVVASDGAAHSAYAFRTEQMARIYYDLFKDTAGELAEDPTGPR